ncbi:MULTISPECIES: Cna B-type domain-containing protein [Kurthia]|uniref:Cna B-type domain-containing protein n=1 Tax=Kurthia TaxID=1649 RepID=UPI0033075DF5
MNFTFNQNADGKPIKYTVKEDTELKDYEVSVDVENKGNIVINNLLLNVLKSPLISVIYNRL